MKNALEKIEAALASWVKWEDESVMEGFYSPDEPKELTREALQLITEIRESWLASIVWHMDCMAALDYYKKLDELAEVDNKVTERLITRITETTK